MRSQIPNPSSNSQLSTQNSQLPKWRGVFFSGPESDIDHEGDECPLWVVYVGDAEAAPTGKVYESHSYAYAATLARSMARERNLELIDEATTA